MEYLFRKATILDTDDIMRIIDFARQQMLSEGKHQWDENYPARIHIENDIRDGIGYVIVADGKTAAYGAIVFTGEPAYTTIKGNWLSDQPYVVLHRIAVAKEARGKGLGARFMQEVEQQALKKGIHSFKVDTNYDNERMQHTFKKQGFTYCGEVSYPKGSRLAYEKLLE